MQELNIKSKIREMKSKNYLNFGTPSISNLCRSVQDWKNTCFFQSQVAIL